MADNVGLNFHTPEELFLGQQPREFVRSFEPSTLLLNDAATIVVSKSHPLDMFLFVGSPGAGKSTFYRKVLQPLGYERVNQDTLKTVCIDNRRISTTTYKG
jgi:bifunctional polynucleotide phosphatase/kinase